MKVSDKRHARGTAAKSRFVMIAAAGIVVLGLVGGLATYIVRTYLMQRDAVEKALVSCERAKIKFSPDELDKVVRALVVESKRTYVSIANNINYQCAHNIARENLGLW